MQHGLLYKRTATVVGRAVLLLGLFFSSGVSPSAQAASSLTLTPVTSAVGWGPIGIDYLPSTSNVVVSTYYPVGVPHNLEEVNRLDGTRTQFSSLSGGHDEIYLSTVRNSRGGFIQGQVYVSNGLPGQIVRISPDGSTVTNPWVTLPGETRLLRGGLYVDRTGAFNGDLIVLASNDAGATTNVWRVNSAGVPTFITMIQAHLEGVIVVPNLPSRYGPLAGKILAGADLQHGLYSISAAGAVQFYPLDFDPESLAMIDSGQTFYGVDYHRGSGNQTIYSADPSQFVRLHVVGDIMISQEFPARLYAAHWTGSSLTIKPLPITNFAEDSLDQWEGITFTPPSRLCPMPMMQMPPPPTPPVIR